MSGQDFPGCRQRGVHNPETVNLVISLATRGKVIIVIQTNQQMYLVFLGPVELRSLVLWEEIIGGLYGLRPIGVSDV